MFIASILFCTIITLSTSSSTKLSASSSSSLLHSVEILQPSDYDLSLGTRGGKVSRGSSSSSYRKRNSKENEEKSVNEEQKEEEQDEEGIGEGREESKEGAYFREYIYRSPASVTTTKKPTTTKSKVKSHKYAAEGSEFHDDDYGGGKRMNGYSGTESAADVPSSSSFSSLE